MEADKRVQVLEDELKLIKAEVMEALVGVRDFLLSADFDSVQQQKQPGLGGMEIDQTSFILTKNVPHSSEEESSSTAASESSKKQEQQEQPEQTGITGNKSSSESAEIEVTDDRVPVESSDIGEGTSQSASRVNVLANLIRWVSMAKRSIGYEQLPAFLEAYAGDNQLSTELKDLIMHLAEVVDDGQAVANICNQLTREAMAGMMEIHVSTGQLSPELKENILHSVDVMTRQAERASAADAWSRLVLELHGILHVGGAMIRLPMMFRSGGGEGAPPENIESEEQTNENKPIRLKLVVPDGDGTAREFSLNLVPEADGDSGSTELS